MEHVQNMLSIFVDDYAYVKEALAFVKQTRDLQTIFDDNQQFVNLTRPDNFGPRPKNLPQEVKAALQDSREFVLTTNRRKIMDEIARCRKEELAWPQLREHLQELQRLKGRRLEQLDFNFDALSPTAYLQRARKETEQRRIEALFAEYQTWIEETMTTEDKLYIRIVAMLRGDQG